MIFSKIKKNSLRSKSISISNDSCKKDQEDLKILRKHLNKARQQYKIAKIKENKIEIDGELYSKSDLESLELDLNEESSDESSIESDEEYQEIQNIPPNIQSTETHKQKSPRKTRKKKH